MGTTGLLRIEIDLDRCQGHGRCYTTAPDLFWSADDFGRACVVDAGVVEAASAAAAIASRAADGCPERAIFVRQGE